MKRKCLIIGLVLLMSVPCYGHGFKEISRNKQGQDFCHEYEHPSGLKVIWIENEEECKSFMLGVKTPTYNDTGVNHIIEHTVFTGSKKYPSASLFFDANSRYPHQYMNALTSGDMTIFPFATPYTEAYEALLDIYLSSIFEPNLLESPYGFYEEAFYYAPKENRYGGVVYNEMKGAMASSQRQIFRKIREVIYEGTPYAFDSGGVPEEIPKLTYEDCTATYRKFYFPGNMKIILYGKLPIERTLKSIETYVEGRTYQEAISLEVQPSSKTEVCKLQVPGVENTVVKSFVLTKALKAEESLALDLWLNTYVMNPNSEFQKALQKAGLYQTKVFKDQDLPYPIYSLVIEEVENPEDALQQLENCVEKLKKVQPQKLLEEDTIARAKWLENQSNESSGRWLLVSESLLGDWAYNQPDYSYYTKQNKLSQMKGFLTAEELQKWFKSYGLILTPMEAKEEIPLSSHSNEEWEVINEALLKWQQQKCELKKMETDCLLMAPSAKIKESKSGLFKTMMTKGKTNFIKSNFYLNTSIVPQEQLPYLFLYAHLLEQSAKEALPFEGNLETKCRALNEKENYVPYLIISLTTQKENTNHGMLLEKMKADLLNEPTEWYEQKLKELILEQKKGIQNNILEVLSYLTLGSETGSKRYNYELGAPFYEWCQSLQGNWIEEVKAIDSIVYRQEALTVGLTLPEQMKEQVSKNIEGVVKNWPHASLTSPNYCFEAYEKQSVLETDSEVDYIFMQATKPFIEGKDYLAAAYLTRYCLTPQIRGHLGAYGTGCQARYPDTISLYTYRDPNYVASLPILQQVGSFMKQNPISEENLWVSQIEALTMVHREFKLLEPVIEQASRMELQILQGIQPKKIIALQKEILAAGDLKDVNLEQTLKQGNWCIATKEKVKNVNKLKIYKFT